MKKKTAREKYGALLRSIILRDVAERTRWKFWNMSLYSSTSSQYRTLCRI